MLGADEGAARKEERGAAGHRVEKVGDQREEHEDAEDRHVRQEEEGDHAALAGRALEGAERRVEGAGEHDRRRRGDRAEHSAERGHGGGYCRAWATASAMSWSMRSKASSSGSSSAITWLMRVARAA